MSLLLGISSGGSNTLVAPLGTLTLTGLVPSFVQSGGNVLQAPLGTLTLTGLVPSFAQPIKVVAPLGTLTLNGLVPSFLQAGANSIIAPLGRLTLSGLAPSFAQSGASHRGGGYPWDEWEGRREKKKDAALQEEIPPGLFAQRYIAARKRYQDLEDEEMRNALLHLIMLDDED